MASRLYEAALTMVATMENGIYFAPEPYERDEHGRRDKAQARRLQRHQEFGALVALKEALRV